uniref:Ubiquitin carboxyl-terminal hydrolase 34 n=1 Tax=Xiphophorus couchianus TaxID=32473 RepID=A0A3B5M8F1_9TELE
VLENCSLSDADGSEGGFQLKKEHALRVLGYISSWSQRQCLCCFKEYKHLEVFNQLVYALINLVITQINSLRNQLCSEKIWNAAGGGGDNLDPFSSWTTEEKEKLLLCAAKIFQIQFPLYTAYKHNTHPTIEDISAHESNILGSFCDMNDVEVPLHLLRYVCLFCGKHGLSLMKECFELGTPESLPFPIAHAFITIVSNIRIWLHIPAVMQHIIPFRTYVIRCWCPLGTPPNAPGERWVHPGQVASLSQGNTETDRTNNHALTHSNMIDSSTSPMVEDMLSADDVSCSSSQVSAKSEKNMADFDGEESGCEEELVQINSHAELSSHLQQHLPNLASIYHEHLVQGPAVHKHQYSSHAVTDINLDNVCKKGNTLLWDLVQDEDAIHLSEGLINEAEKLLCSLVCWFTDRQIRMRFIEGCLDNLAHHRSVVVSLRLLPKLFGTFQQFGSSYDTHWITMWAEKELHMMKLFFDNLQHYIQEVREHRHKFALYSHSAEVQVRLQFLTCVFSTLGSPDHFRLSLEQVDILWHCLVEDAECYDDALHWFLNQVRSKDQHAMGMETYKHLFLEKMPQLKPETISMTGLNLFQHLCNLARLATSTLDNASNCELCGMDQLWGIALRAQSADISRAAIQYINSYYINAGKTGLEKEQEFIRKCMESLLMASANLEKDAHSSLTSIERGLLMLKTHLEAFRRRFAYHLRQWQIEGTGISSHLKALSDKQSLPLRIVCQPAGLPDKMTIEMYPSDQVADLRAEVTHWYENLQKEQMNQQAQLQEFGQSSRQQGDFPGGLMGPVRMISSGHELTTDYDEKTLHELGFKDMQMVFVSLGAPRRERKGEGVQLPASCLPPPQKEHIPMLLLLQEPHLTTLFDLLEMLACFKPPSPNTEKLQESPESARCEELHLHAENLSRRVWELLMLLPTCPKMLQAFQNISDETSGESLCWKELLRIKSPHKLLYALEIIEALGKPNRRIHRESTGSYSDLYPDSDDSSEDQIENSKNTWSCKFVSSGGLQLLLEIFNSGILEPKDQESWTVWQLDCLACLLKLICQFAVDPADLDLAYHDVFSWSGLAESQRKRAWPGKSRKSTVEHGKGLHIPRLTEVFLSLVQGTNLIQRLINVAYTYDNLAHRVLKAQSDHRSRHEVTHYSMWLLVSWAHCSSTVKSSLADSDHLHDWLKKLTLLVPEPAVRHEACNGLYKLSLSGLEGGESINRSFLLLAASTLLKFLPDAQALKPLRVEDYEEEPLLRTGCKEYFWLLCKLIDNIHVKDASQTTLLDLDALARHLADCIRSREILDQQDGNIEDDGLTGLLRLATSVLKHKPPFKFSREGQEFLRDVYNLLFLLPSLADRAQPKCKSHSARAAAYDLLVEMVKGSVENYRLLHNWVMSQHMQSSHAPYKWDYWPHDDVRAECRFVGLTNLGATCYMASTIQQLYMIPEARQAVFTAKYSEEIKHKTTLLELQKMFTYLMESERKAYNPRPFCKTYTMDKQPLNTGEQKDMTEFFTDLITKIEEMSQELKNTVKTLFGGVITNNVVSLDCDHVSQTAEEFYTVRCQVADMKNIYESLDEVTIKDTLEGDNMYTCSQCGKKVRAEKRACFKKLPRILSFNTMRYTFNMVTMMKEKVNTHFSFPLRLNMTPYTEDFLMGKGERKEGFREEREQSVTESYEYDLIGVTVHTGTADGGHYYSFIRDIVNPHAYKNNKWYLFNDAEVKPFDSAQLASECFGGEMTTKTYDSVTDKFMDFSFEKTHSAYMLFYKRVELEEENGKDFSFDVSPDLLEWIWHDNMQFLQDKNIFEHTYFGFMWQLCSSIPSTLPDPKAVSLMTAKLSTSFVLETFIHSKEKPTMLQWIELLTKQFNNNQAACEWFLDRMADDNWWPMQILIKCPNQIVRQMFQRLCIHVIQRLRPVHAHLYLQPGMEDGSDDMDGPVEDIGSRSCVTRFVKTLLSIMEHGVKPHSKHLTEYFAFLYEFAKMGEEESQFLLSLQAISIMVHFYMGTKGPENPQVEVLSEEEAEEEDEEEDILSLAEEKYRPAALEKMIALIALLVEQSRSERHLTLSQSDMAALTGGKGFPFLFQHIRDGINIRQTCNLIFSLCRYNNRLAEHIVSMLFTSIAKLTPEAANPFFKLLTMLMEFAGGPPGMPSFASYILQRIWEVIEYNPSQCLDWLAVQTPRNKLAHSWVLQNMENWVERFLLAHNYPRVRTCEKPSVITQLINIKVIKTIEAHQMEENSPSEPISCALLSPSAFRVLLENDEDRLLVVFNRGLILMTESFNTLHMMYHEATACHVTGDLVELLSIFLSVLKSTRPYLQRKDVKQALIQWQERIDFAHKLLTLLNSYSPPELRNACLDVLKELVLLSPHDFLHTLVPFLQHNHCTYHHSNIPMSFGPYLPCRENIKLMGAKNNIRPPRPELNMCLLPSLVESSKGKDEVYDRMLLDYFLSYHQFIHLLCRVAINCEKFTDTLVKLSVLIAYEGLPLHLALFPKLWTELCQSQSVLAKTCVKLLCDDPAFSEYIKCILMDERTFLNNNMVYSFLTCFLPKVPLQVLSGPSCSNLISVLVTNLLTEQSNLQPELALHRVELNKTSSLLNADLRSLVLLLSIQPPPSIDAALCPALQELLGRCRLCLQQRSSLELEAKDLKSKAEDEGATPVKRRRVSSDDDREALTPASTSDTETRDSSSLIDPGTEQDPPSPEPTPATSRNMDSALKEEKMEVSSSSSSSFSSSSSSSLLQDAGDGFVQVEEPEAPQSVKCLLYLVNRLSNLGKEDANERLRIMKLTNIFSTWRKRQHWEIRGESGRNIKTGPKTR